MNVQDRNGIDRARWYETRRNELLKLLDRTRKVEIPERYAIELSSIRKKCLENQFEIVLVGEFQGGKSTTFNALCDGRDLSPRGLGGGGIKTSAAIISAQNISDDESKNGMKEWAEITFKTKYDIQKGMFDILHEVLNKDRVFCESVIQTTKIRPDDLISKLSTADGFASILDLDNAVHRRSVRNALNVWWSQWETDKSLLDEDDKDKLRIATLQERFYGSNEYRELLKSSSVGIYDFQSLIAFPTDWIIRWQEGKNTSFKLHEVAFIFIARTLLRIHSENLASLGCRITDCPGLFANAYDTSVAQYAISHSDAIWYLIGGEKTIGEKDLKSLDFIKQMGMASKIIGSVNLKGKHSTKMEQVFPATKAMLCDHGFSFPLLQYNARLAFLSAQGKRISDGLPLSDYERRCMQIDSDNEDGVSSIVEMWVEMVNDSGVNTGLKELKYLDNVSSESVSLVRLESHIDEIKAFLTKDIISKKSRSILIDNGSQKAAHALQEYEGILRISEDAAVQDEYTWKKSVAECEKALNLFIEKSEEIIKESPLISERTLLSRNLARELISQAINDSFIDKVAFLFAKAIHYYKGKASKDCLINYLGGAVMQYLDPLFRNSIMNVLTSWAFDEPSHDTYIFAFKDRTDKIVKQIRRLWNTDIGTKNYIKDIPLEMPTDSMMHDNLVRINDTILNNTLFIEVMMDKYFSLLRRLKQSIISFCTKISEWFGGLMGITRTQQDQRKRDEQAKRDLEDKLRKFAKDKIRPVISSPLKMEEFQKEISVIFIDKFDEMQNTIIKNIQQSISSLHSRFMDEHVTPARRHLTESECKRKEIAERNHQIRVEQIEPLRIEIQNFEAQVSKEIDL